MTDLAGRHVLITGGGSGIGRLTAVGMARRGARVTLWDLDEARLVGALSDVAAAGTRGRGYACDVSDRTAVRAVGARVLEEVGTVDVLVNNAGVISGAGLLDLSEEKIERTFGVNVLALYWVTKAFLPAMVAQGRGHVVTVASAAGLVGVARQTDYSASKHAAVGFDESLRAEMRRVAPGVRTTVVCPFYIDTGMFEGVRTKVPWLLPILRQQDVANKLVRAVEKDRAQLILPPAVRVIPPGRLLPVAWFDKIADLMGVNASMEEFVGRKVETDVPAAAVRSA